jgi:glutamate dehydrogenase (NAD(P)+)
VQGLGNVGYHSAKFLQHEGKAIIVGLAEIEGAIVSGAGLDVDAVVEHRKATGSILNYPRAHNLPTSGAALELDCDILVPAALENQITAENAPRIAARVIAEAANGPVDAHGEKILLERGRLIIPDVYLNAGGVTVSYFEWLKNLSHVRFGRITAYHEETTHQRFVSLIERLTGKQVPDEERAGLVHGARELDFVRSGLAETMITAYADIRHIARERKIPDLRSAAFALAIERVAETYQVMGIFP